MSKKYVDLQEDNQFALSTGDLMAALLLIFVLLLIGTILQLQETFETKSNIAERYKELQMGLYNDLSKEFENDFEIWDAEIDTTLSIRFKEPEVLFGGGKSVLTPRFRDILNDFFPRYIEVLRGEKYLNHIEEIRIEGHTSIEWLNMNDDDPDYAYIKNMELSQDRSRAVLKFCLDKISSEKEVNDWTKVRTTANGLSSVKPIADNQTQDGRSKNRRVEFRIKTDAEEQLRVMLRYAGD